ncbi:hypothetical protein HDIA_2464 [Hartmannibacter diazotrophicus]|uniref:Class I SAM-dependent methyltransferase n=1 Tax=Hartmannibacter diazotrophicus TaxID=1482074 RepID=A0A2C9D8U5_9HYPH|nr:hypothetical protein HDIA_2464 [Hartmannibacter diazotrophicus]
MLKGENAQFLYETLRPSSMTLVDSWSAEEIMSGYSPFDSLPSYIDDLSATESYFGGPLDDQATFDRLLAEAKARFTGRDNVKFVVADSFKGLDQVADSSLDLVYLDANHQYEFIYRDLMYWKEKVNDNGLIVLNDCIVSQLGARQNLGVHQAVSAFLKINVDYLPLVLTLGNFPDLVISKRRNPRINVVLTSLLRSGRVLEVPDALFHSFSQKSPGGGMSYFSFN